MMRLWRLLLTCGLALAPSWPARGQTGLEVPPRPNGPYEIRGVVVDAKSGQPLPEVELSIEESAQPENPPFEVIQSEANGSFRIENLAPGKYSIRATRQGYAEQAYLQHENYWSGIAVGEGKDSMHVCFPLSASATITGQVTDENGEPVRGAEITLWREQMENGVRSVGQIQGARTDDEGRYRLGHLLAGKYSVSVVAMPWYSRYVPGQVMQGWMGRETARTYNGALFATGVPVRSASGDGQGSINQNALPDVVYAALYYPNARDWHGMGWISLQVGETESADFRLIPEPSAHMQVRVREGDIGERPNVAVMKELPTGGQSNLTPSMELAASGLLEISGLPAGQYHVQVGGETADAAVDVAGNSPLHFEDRETAGGRTINGVIQPTEGEAKIEGVLLHLKDAVGHTYSAFVVDNPSQPNDSPGRFQFQHVPSGAQALELSIVQPQDLMVKTIEAKGAKVTGKRIDTSDSEEVSLIVTAARVSSVVTGTALKKGKPFAGAMILLMPEGGRDWEQMVRRDQSDSDGTFRLSTVLPGRYVLMALEHGWEMEWSKPEVLRPYLVKAQKLEIGEGQSGSVALEVQ